MIDRRKVGCGVISGCVLALMTYFYPCCLQAQTQPAAESDKLLYKIDFPDDVGTVEQRWEGNSGKTIMLVQDSHISLEVQLNIAKIIQSLVNDYDIKLVNIEGADHEKIDFQELRELEPRDVVERVSVEFLKESRINGAVYAKINNEKDFLQYGTEDKEKYLENYTFYLKVIENNKGLMDFFSVLRAKLMKNKQKFLSPALIEFLNVEILFKDGDTSLISYFKVIIKNANELNIDLIDYPSISQMIEIALSDEQAERFNSVDNEKLLDELAQLSKVIIAKLSTTPRAEQFIGLLWKVMRFQDMLRLRVLPDDYIDFLEKETEYKEANMQQEIAALFPDMDMTQLMGADQMLNDMKLFYSNAHDRSGVIFRNSLESMKTEGVDMSVIVSGGFHTNELVNLCKDHDISYLRIMPTVTSTEATVDYEGRMIELKSELITDEQDAPSPT